ncbi:ssDNA-binding protein [Aeromonas phage phiAS4]|nr:ssDNA-binding protein [Aeromonas phage phiAS4]ADM79623.1 ssDNA-binding protein [Aeromonas phage phiAS4]
MGTSIAAGSAASAASSLSSELNDFDEQLTSFDTDVVQPSVPNASSDLDDDLDALLG